MAQPLSSPPLPLLLPPALRALLLASLVFLALLLASLALLALLLASLA